MKIFKILWLLPLFLAGLVLITNPTIIVSSSLIDYFFSLDQSHRVLNNVLPYRDFDSPIGPFFYINLYLAHFFVPIEKVPALSNWTAIWLMIPSYFVIKEIAKEKTIISLFVLWFPALAYGLSPLSVQMISWIAPYNSISITLFSVVLVSLFTEKFDKKFLICLSIIVLCLFMTKISYGIVCLMCFFVISIMRKNIKIFYALIPTILCFLLWAIVDYKSLSNYVMEILRIIQISGGADRLQTRITSLQSVYPWIGLALGITVSIIVFIKKREFFIPSIICQILCWLVILTDHIFLPWSMLVLLILTTQTRKYLLMPIYICFFLWMNAQTLWQYNASYTMPDQGLGLLGFAVNPLPNNEEVNSIILANYYKKLEEFAAKNELQNKSVLQLDFTQMLGWKFGTLPSKEPAWFDLYRTFSSEIGFTRWFVSDYVIVPKKPLILDITQTLVKAMKDKPFKLILQDENFYLFKRLLETPKVDQEP